MRASDDRKGTPGITEWSRARVPIDPAVCYLAVGPSHPGRAAAAKGRVVHPLKGNASWVNPAVSPAMNKPAYNGGAPKEFMMLTEKQKELIIGSLLGDGYLEKRGESVRFGFSQSKQRVFYVKWKYEQLRDLVSEPIKCYEYIDHRTGKKYGLCSFKTRAHPWFSEIYPLFYKDGKTVPSDIKKMLTPFAVAVWYMDNGSLSRGAPIFNTQSYSVSDLFKLCSALKKFHITANLNRDRKGYRLRILKRHAARFRELVEPYILQEFLYKLPGGNTVGTQATGTRRD